MEARKKPLDVLHRWKDDFTYFPLKVFRECASSTQTVGLLSVHNNNQDILVLSDIAALQYSINLGISHFTYIRCMTSRFVVS